MDGGGRGDVAGKIRALLVDWDTDASNELSRLLASRFSSISMSKRSALDDTFSTEASGVGGGSSWFKHKSDSERVSGKCIIGSLSRLAHDSKRLLIALINYIFSARVFLSCRRNDSRNKRLVSSPNSPIVGVWVGWDFSRSKMRIRDCQTRQNFVSSSLDKRNENEKFFFFRS